MYRKSGGGSYGIRHFFWALVFLALAKIFSMAACADLASILLLSLSDEVELPLKPFDTADDPGVVVILRVIYVREM